MKPWVRFLTLPLVLLPIMSGAQEQKQPVNVVAFDDIPRYINERNQSVGAARTTVDAQKQRTGHLTRSFLPELNVLGGGEKFRQNAVSESRNFWKLEGRVNLYDGNRDRLEEKVRQSNVQVARIGLDQEYNIELREARKLYWQIVASDQLIADLRSALEKNESNIKSARRRTGAGVATSTDAVQFELHQTRLTQQFKQLSHEREVLGNRLAVILGLDASQALQVAKELPHPPEGEFRNDSIDSRNVLDLKSIAEHETATRLLAKKDSRWWLPQVDLYTSYGVPAIKDQIDNRPADDVEFVAGVQVKFELGSALGDRAESRAKLLEAQALQKRAEHRVQEVVSEDRELRHELELIHELLHDSEKDIERAETFLKMTRAEYNRGVKNGPDLLGAFQQVYEFRERRINLYLKYAEAKADFTALQAQERVP